MLEKMFLISCIFYDGVDSTIKNNFICSNIEMAENIADKIAYEKAILYFENEDECEVIKVTNDDQCHIKYNIVHKNNPSMVTVVVEEFKRDSNALWIKL